MNNNTAVITAVSRILLSAIFLVSGAGKLANLEGTAGYMASVGMPLVPLFLAGAVALEVVGGLSLLLGWKARWGAAALIAFLVPTTLLFHDFWAFEGMEQRMQQVSFLKNVAIMGGLGMVIAYGAGALSLDARVGRRQEAAAPRVAAA